MNPLFRRLLGAPPVLRTQFLAMGTQVTLTLPLRRRSDAPAAKAAMQEVAQALVSFGREWWAWGPGTLSQINRLIESGETVRIPEPMRGLFARAWAMREATGGAFEPRIASLVRLWGFDDVGRIRQSPPLPREIQACLDRLRAAPGYDGGDRYGPSPGTGWDFGGIAKGWIVDRALDRLTALGFADASLDAGGNLAVRGAHPHRPWNIGIRKPLEPGEDIDAPQLLATLDACDESVNTHGDDQRFFIHEGRRYGHLLSPFTGWPVRGLRALTVVHADGAIAEAGGAALYVAGLDGWQPLAARLGITQLLMVTDDGRVLATPALLQRLRPAAGLRIGTLPPPQA